METADDRALRNILLERIGARGSITFAEFMAACLYEPRLGYYTSPGRKVGAEGDFYTSSNVHRVFGRLIAREIVSMWRTMGEPADFQIVEAGAANGRLSADIMDAIAQLEPALYAVVTCRLIEAEPSLAESQRTMLADHLPRLAWSTPEELAAGALEITGCLLTNELVDALPVHLVEMTSDGLREVMVTAEGDAFREQLAPLSTQEIPLYLQRLGVSLVTGQRAEIRLAADRWLQGVARSLRRGFVITIDYGYQAEELYSPMRKNGTLLCYYRHQAEEDPYIRIGLQDITSHVDFTSLVKCGEEAGLTAFWYGEQYRFLMAAGMMEELLALESRPVGEEQRLKDRLALKKLMLPDGGMGDTFKVLVQGKGVERPELLCMGDWTTRLQGV
ncbi:MAG TPA: SAM-dependent methyltransferase [Geobacteraceae bacterium]|nr:SAM-dependent methyltransferase [Geobacteraceae bacterium]